MKSKVIVVSTKANGGIKTVVDSYSKSKLSESYDFVYIFSHHGGNKLIDIIIYIKALIALLFNLVSGHKVYHLHMSMRGSFVRKYIMTKLIQLFSAKVIIHLHGSEFKNYYNSSSERLRSRIKDLFETAERTIVLSESWKSFILSIAPNSRVTVVNNFVEEIQQQPIERSNEITFLFMGNVGSRKGAFELIEAFCKLQVDVPVKLIMCGDGDLDRARALINANSAERKIELVGWVDAAERSKYYSIADVVILPSHNEGLPMTILEAMSCKKVVIATPVGGIPEVIENGVNGILVEPGNIESIIDGMKYAIGVVNDSNFRNLAYDSYKRRFSPDTIVPQIDTIYRELV